MVDTVEDIRAALSSFRGRTVVIEDAMKCAAVAAVVRQSPDLEILLIHRADHPNDPWSGHISFPGGRVEADDPSALDAAVRETKEEVGLDLNEHGQLLGELSHVPAVARGKRVPLVIVPFVFSVEGGPVLTPNHEVQEPLWVPFSFFADPENRSSQKRRFAGLPVTMPCYRYEGRLIWGLTLKMLDELFGLVGLL